ncbi:SDR family NAD(P)-dependent oxidoreductase [Streptomyces sp. AV19]|uniref:type I polyketide synthase n=1 Tax=Streptomyces sp. AV19 TaxID=2793068 RepID=UPI0018FE9C6E|nr:type I polyketide synthase [Streptomyces sp. AV19]MBH1933293.1 SDR family NAD(P)-dependent oxidoreductase [Streptomyces sp. AV19]MDG4536184.1 SDR family NAD(P)-dependent oxidoreductase [Streptomyces sp. AV19]
MAREIHLCWGIDHQGAVVDQTDRYADRALARDPIAIVGLAGMFPKSRDVRAFWDNIVTGRDCTEEVPAAWWDLEDHYDPDPLAPDRTYGRRGGFLTPVTFDPREFGMPPRTVDSTGLVQLLGLMVARDVLRDAAHGRQGWHEPSRTGVVLGVCGTNSTLMPLAARLLAPLFLKTLLARGLPEDGARRIARDYLRGLPEWTEDSFPGILGNVVSGRIANRLDLRAANHTVDAACASSLAAVRAAVDELLGRRADVMLTGGCDADNSIVSFMCFSKTPALSLTGRVRPFDARADGTLIGEGIGMLALKRLADAERDEDRVYAVLRGLGSSSDGIAKSIYAPCGEGQLAALRRAYADAGCPPSSVGLIEAHGTGTPAGDEVELTALGTLLEGAGPVAVGSIKSQIGHTKAAAGAAGLIKAALALHHRLLPPTINVDEPTAAAGRTLYVNTAARPWIRDPGRPARRAGVSSFGFGGVNYHAVLEEHTAAEGPWHRVPRALLWHAPDPAALLALLETGAEPCPGPVPPGHARLGCVAAADDHRARLLATAAARLRDHPDAPAWRHPLGLHYRRAALPPGTRTAALFAGQGSQYTGMGLRALLAVPPLRDAFDEANALWPPGETPADAAFPRPGGEDGELLKRTDYAQAAIGALSAGQYRFLRGLGLAPHAVLGHSFGELTAVWAAGAIDDRSFTALARARGRALHRRPPGGGDDPGAMAAVRADRARVAELLTGFGELAVCNHNAPDEHVVGGPTASVHRFVDHCARRSVTARPLPVAAAFHTPLVGHALEPFAAACAGIPFAAPRIPVRPGAEGAAYGPDPEAGRRTLVEQLRRPVDFAARLTELYEDGVRVFVEFGPGSVLSSLVERTLGPRAVEAVACDRGPGTDSALALKDAVVRLTVLGLPLGDANHYDVPPPPEPPAPSRVARVLEGPGFAALRARRAADAAAAADGETRPPLPLAAAAADPLAQAVADHLAAHIRYLDGQMETSRELTGLLRSRAADGRVDEAFAATVTAIGEQALALGRAHARAGEVVTELLGGTGDGQGVEPPRATPDPVVDIPAVEPGPADDSRSAPAALLSGEEPPPPAPQAVTDVSQVGPEEVERVLRGIVAEKTGYDLDMIEPDMYIQEDLGIDSLKQVEIGAEVWRRYPFVKREDLFRLSEARTVAELTGMIWELFADPRLSSGGGGAVPSGRARITLRDLPPVDVRTDACPDRPRALLVDDGGDLCAALRTALDGRGWRLARLALPGTAPGDGPAPLADWTEDALVDGLSEALAGDPELDLCLLPVSRSRATTADATVTRLGHALLTAKQIVPVLRGSARDGRRTAFVTVTQLDGALGHEGSGGDPVAALAGGLAGLVKSVALEAAPVFFRALDFAPGTDPAALGEAFAEEIADAATDVTEVARDGLRRRTPDLLRCPGGQPSDPRPESQAHGDAGQTPVTPAPAAPPLTRDDVLLVTGATGGITAWCLTALAGEHRCGYLLAGRAPADEPRVASLLDALRAHGARADYVRADLRDPRAVERALAPHAPRVTGVIHAAGVLGDRPLAEMTAESARPVVETKLSGLHHVLAALDVPRLRHLVVFSSVAGLWGNVRQADYALANEALVRYARAVGALHPACRVLPVVWGPWEGGMAAGVHQLFTAMGVPVLSRATGTAHFRDLMASGPEPAGTVVVGPLAPWFDRADELPDSGLTCLRRLDGLDRDPVLDHHRVGDHPLVPMTALVGAAVNAIERARGGGAPVTWATGFRINRGLYLNGGQPHALGLRITPGERTGTAHVAARDDGDRGGRPHFEGTFGWTGPAGEAPRLELPDCSPSSELHPCYAEGRLFHGPSLAGLRGEVLEDGPRLTVQARLPAPAFAAGAWAGRRYDPCLADLLLQAAALVGYRSHGILCAPLSVERIDLHAPLPDGETFLVVGELNTSSVLDLHCTVTACAPDGRVLQRWTGLRMLAVGEGRLRRTLENFFPDTSPAT